MDLRKIVAASRFTIGIGVVLVLISFAIPALALLPLSSSVKELLGYAVIGYTLIMIPIFLGLYFWTGMRAVKNYGLDELSAGAVSAFSYLVVAIVYFILEVLVRLAIAGWMAGLGGEEFFPEFVAISGLIGIMGLAISVLWAVIAIPLGVIINFIVGVLGALYVKR